MSAIVTPYNYCISTNTAWYIDPIEVRCTRDRKSALERVRSLSPLRSLREAATRLDDFRGTASLAPDLRRREQSCTAALGS